MSLPALSLYIHIPWCIKKCPYCDFNSHQKKADLPEKAYLTQLLRDLAQQIQHFPDLAQRPIISLFFGGGTPSLMSADFYQQLLQRLKQTLQLHPDIEITLEANPGTFETARFAGFLQAGINRLSIGVQSFNAQHLQKLGRIHSNTEAITAINTAKGIGFTNFNIDLMYALPDQSIAQALADLDQAAQLGNTHLSWYQLTIEQNTEFFKRPPTLPKHEYLFDMQLAGQQRIAELGFTQYEISAYSHTGKQAKHNVNYWSFGDYIGLGAGAHGKITDADNNIIRTQRSRLPEHYLNKPLHLISQPIKECDYLFEVLMNGFRLKNGISWQQIAAHTQLDRQTVLQRLQVFIDQQLVIANSQRIYLSDKGYLFLDQILAELI